MFAIEMLPAGHGDALVVEWGPRNRATRLLVDAGTYHSWADVRTRLKRRRTDGYELFVVTHVDEDHIGGAIALLDDPDLRHRVSTVWFNGFNHCDAPRLEREGPDPSAPGINVLGPVNGEQLTERIVNTGLAWNPSFEWGSEARRRGLPGGGPVVVPDDGDLPTIDLPGQARLVLLSPTDDKLERMAKVWEREVRRAGLVEGEGDPGHNVSPSPFNKRVDPLPDQLDRDSLRKLAARKQRDGSEANGSSIAFVIEHDGKRLLLAGDAHPAVLAKALTRYGSMVGEPVPRIDLVKLAHHGSGANLSATLVKKWRASRFMISSDGQNFAHPDDSAIARAMLAVDDAEEPTFYCNYRSDRTEQWAEMADKIDGIARSPVFVLPKQGKSGLRVTV